MVDALFSDQLPQFLAERNTSCRSKPPFIPMLGASWAINDRPTESIGSSKINLSTVDNRCVIFTLIYTRSVDLSGKE
ncbi:MAG: hypothetical protein HC769_20395 [Cyanobacteria bacterium CRU_2_1]|nr:hypothetical protein [Cyanobacteria bacterium CRU_2_1]